MSQLSGRRTAAALVCMLLMLSACAQLPPALPPHSVTAMAVPLPRIIVLGVTEQDRLNDQVLARLREPRRFEFNDRPLVAIIDKLREETGINFYVNWAALEAAGIEKDFVPTKLHVYESAYEVLQQFDRIANEGALLEPLGFDVIDGVVRISTSRDLEKHTVTRLYVLPATSLQPVSLTRPLPVFDPATLLNGDSSQGPDEQNKDGMVIDNGLVHIITYDEGMEKLTTYIQDIITLRRDWKGPHEFRDPMREFNGVLIIRTHLARHAEIETLLAKIAIPDGIQSALRSEEASLLITRADQLRLTNQHRHALILVNAALRVAPDDARARALHDVLTQSASQKFRYEPIRPALAEVDRSLVTLGPLPLSQFTLAVTDEAAPLKDALRRLNEPISVKFEGNKLIDVFEHLQRITSVPFTNHWDALESAGIEQDLPITLEFKQVPARVVLDLVLSQAGAGALLEPIDYDVRLTEASTQRANVVVSTTRHLSSPTVLRQYPVQDLLAIGGELYSPRLLYARKNRPLIDSMRFDPLNVFAKDACFPHADTLTTYEEELEILTVLIQDFIGRQSDWSAYGGEVSSLHEQQGTLYIKTTPANHRDIEILLTQLRQAQRISLASLMRHREILPLLRQAEAHRFAQRYSAALELIAQALRVDPQHEIALAVQQVIRETLSRR